MVGDAGEGRRLRPAGGDQHDLHPRLARNRGRRERGGILADQHEAQARREQLRIARTVPCKGGRGFVTGVALQTVARPHNRAARGKALHQRRRRRILRPNRLDQHGDRAATGELDVDPRTALAIAQDARRALGDCLAAMARNIGLDTAARQEAPIFIGGHQHLRARLARGRAFDRDQRGDGESLAPRQHALERQADIVDPGGQSPVGHARSVVAARRLP